MADKILMLALSPTMTEGVVSKWLKQPGEHVAEGDLLCEVETDKAVMELEASTAGMLLHVLKQEGDRAVVGEAIAWIGEAGETVPAARSEPSGTVVRTLPQEPIVLAPIATSPVEAPAVPADVSTRPAPVEASPVSPLRSSPLARRIAEQGAIQLATVHGSGPRGRIVAADVRRAIDSRDTHLAVDSTVVENAAATAAAALAERNPDAKPQPVRRMPIGAMRRRIAERLSASMREAPHYYLKKTIEADPLMSARQSFKEAGHPISINAFLIRLAAAALARHPMVHASWRGGEIEQFASADIGLAVAIPGGLVTPVVRDVGAKGLVQIQRELDDLIERARSGRLNPEEHAEATFTISNLGSAGIDEFTAIINPPGSAILAVGAARRMPISDGNDAVRVATMMTLTLSCDHRVIDGAVGAAFLKDLANLIEQPLRGLL